MKITNEWLAKVSACGNCKKWFTAQTETNGKKVVQKLVTETKLDWANWLVVRLLNRKEKIRYAIFAAEQVIDMFEEKYPNDKLPRIAIDAAKAVLEHDTKANRAAASAAADAAAYAAADAAASAAAYAAAMKQKIIEYGITLIEGVK